jgi:PAS domain S-box-containing protein
MPVKEIDSTIKAQALRLAKENPGAMVAVFESATSRYLYASPSHEQLLGYKPEELIGRTLRKRVFPSDLGHTMLGFMDAVLHGKSIEITVRLVSKSGHPVRVRASATHVVTPDGDDLMLGKATPVDD